LIAGGVRQRACPSHPPFPSWPLAWRFRLGPAQAPSATLSSAHWTHQDSGPGPGNTSPDISYSKSVAEPHSRMAPMSGLWRTARYLVFCAWKWGVWTGMEEQILAGKPVHGVPSRFAGAVLLSPHFQGFSSARGSAVLRAMRNGG
jgi:hypothetical protein